MKKYFLIAGLVLVIGIGTSLALSSTTQGEFDINGLNQQVQNHEARITNVEKDVAAVQANTGSQPAPDHVDVPSAPSVSSNPVTSPETPTQGSVTTTAVVDPTPSPAPTVVSSSFCREGNRQGNGYDYYRRDHYSDGNEIDVHVSTPENPATLPTCGMLLSN